MSTEKLLKCDLCGVTRNVRDLHSESTTHIYPKRVLRFFWWRGSHSEGEFDHKLDICAKCLELFHKMRREMKENEKETK